MVRHYMVGDTYTEVGTGEQFELSAIGTSDMSGRKRLTSVSTKSSMWLADEELDQKFTLAE